MNEVVRIKFEPENLPAILKSIRLANGVSQSDIAEFLAFKSTATVSFYERGLRKISCDELSELAEAYGYTATIVFKRMDE